MRFSQSRMYKKRALYRGAIKKLRKGQKKVEKKPAPRMIKKEIGGEKNGGHRIVRVNRMVSHYLTGVCIDLSSDHVKFVLIFLQ